MNPAQLLAHFDRISDAPDAIPRLRRFILDLAVRGKLVEQDQRDEPASELLKRIQTENACLVLSGNITTEAIDPLDHIVAHFKLPIGWVWTRLGEICSKTGSGSTPRGGRSAYQDQGIPFIRSQNVYNDGLRLNDIAYIDQQTHKRMKDTVVKAADLLLNITGGSMGRCCRVPDDFDQANISQHVAIIRAVVPGMQDFLHRLILSPYFQSFIFAEQTGAGRGGLPKNKMDRIPVALPPLAEQHRIVTKVDELMSLCDRLEGAQNERENRRDRLVASSLNRLSNGADANAFHDQARFYFNHLPHLTTKREHIQQLRQTILNLAVRGKLVPQDPNDEPASELLNRIRAEKEALVKECKVKPSMPLLDLAEETMPFHLPPNWRWVRFGELIIEADAGWSPKSEGFPRTADNWGVLKVSAVSWDTFLPEENKQLLPGVIPPKAVQVRAGDFLISRANTSELVAKCAVVGDVPRNLILSDKIVRLQITTDCNKKFLSIVNNHAEHARSYYAEEASGTSLSMKNVSRAVIYALVIPLPPLAEQQRIVAKVDELRALCDKLDAQLTTTHTESRRLLDAVLHEALKPAFLE